MFSNPKKDSFSLFWFWRDRNASVFFTISEIMKIFEWCKKHFLTSYSLTFVVADLFYILFCVFYSERMKHEGCLTILENLQITNRFGADSENNFLPCPLHFPCYLDSPCHIHCLVWELLLVHLTLWASKESVSLPNYSERIQVLVEELPTLELQGNMLKYNNRYFKLMDTLCYMHD